MISTATAVVLFAVSSHEMIFLGSGPPGVCECQQTNHNAVCGMPNRQLGILVNRRKELCSGRRPTGMPAPFSDCSESILPFWVGFSVHAYIVLSNMNREFFWSKTSIYLVQRRRHGWRLPPWPKHNALPKEPFPSCPSRIKMAVAILCSILKS